MIEQSYGADHLDLVLAKGYLARILGNSRVVRYLAQHQQEMTSAMNAVAARARTGRRQRFMINCKMLIALLMFVTLVSIAPNGIASAQNEVARGNGEVRKVDKEAGKVTIKHGPLEGMNMPAMTMVFRPKDAEMLDQLKEGDQIAFTTSRQEGRSCWRLSRLRSSPRRLAAAAALGLLAFCGLSYIHAKSRALHGRFQFVGRGQPLVVLHRGFAG